MQPNYVALGDQVRKYRKLMGMNQHQLADAAGLAPTMVSKIECGSYKDRGMSIATLVKIAEALGTSPMRLLEASLQPE